ncbi:MAG TPA: iron chelate uptake ABC transporter family permease subunit [Capillimicrobium sp.]|jgi:iron complex transport system permease protein
MSASPATTAPVAAPALGRRAVGLALALVALAVAVASSLAFGSLSIPLDDVVRAFTAPDGSDAQVVVTELRVPRTIVGALVGAALGAAGALMQGVTRNPLADPGILGINAGAALAVVIAISAFGVSSVGIYAAFAMVGAGITAVLVFALGGSGRGGATPVKLALAGAVLAALLVSVTSAVLVFETDTLDEFRFWIVGSIAGRDTSVALGVLPFIAVGMLIALVAGRWLNALALGDDVATALGQRVALARGLSALGFVLLAGGAVAAAGPIAFIALTVPHVARAICGPDYRWIVPYSIVLGATLLLGADVLGRLVARPGELEVGVVSAVIGAPFFIWLIRRREVTEL